MIDHVFKTWLCGVMVSVLPSSVIDHVIKTWLCGVMVSVLPFVCDRSRVQDLVVWCNG